MKRTVGRRAITRSLGLGWHAVAAGTGVLAIAGLAGRRALAIAAPAISGALATATLAITGALAIAALAPDGALAAAGPQLNAREAILVAPATGQELYGLDANREVAIASTTKLMTALVTLEHTRLNRVFADPDYHPAAEDSQLGLVPGERMSVHDLLLAMLLPSADDAAEDLAYNVGHGSVARFVGTMNRRARQLGLVHTHYSTPIGLDTPGNHSTASDLVKLAGYVLRTQPFFARAVASRRAVLRTGDAVRVVGNRNDLVGRFPWINGVKTGHTLDAGYVLVASGRRDGMTLLSAVLGTPSEVARDDSTLALLDYGFSRFRMISPIRAGTPLARPTIKDRPGQQATVIAAHTLTRALPPSAQVRIRVSVPRQLAGPLPRHAVVGSAVVFAGRRVVGRVPLLLARALPAVSPLALAGNFVTRTSTVVSALVLLCAAIALAIRWRARAADGRGGAERA
jgi:serine-type D-Ala-D-Ala carboxypeptidase (penicillin-binding protein 5/6)